MGVLDNEIDRLGHPHGVGAPERVRQGGHRAWLPDPGARADPRGGPRTARPVPAPAVTPLALDQRGHG